MKRLWPVALAAHLAGCVFVNPEARHKVSPEAVDLGRSRSMVQSTMAGPLKIDSVVYKPKYLPLARFLKRLAKGNITDARRMAPFRYNRSNVDDKALKALIKKGFIPVFIETKNMGAEAIDAQGLRVLLNDESIALAPIPNDELPTELRSLNPKAMAANTHNMAMVIVSVVVILTAAAFLDKLDSKISKKSTSRYTKKSEEFLGDAVEAKLWGDGTLEEGVEVSIDAENAIFNPITETTEIDYNGLLFSPGTLAPGQSAKGLLFFKARSMDWSALRLEASLAR